MDVRNVIFETVFPFYYTDLLKQLRWVNQTI
jgi:hypothetical protein